MQFNWIHEKGGFVMHPNGRFSVDFSKVTERNADRNYGSVGLRIGMTTTFSLLILGKACC